MVMEEGREDLREGSPERPESAGQGRGKSSGKVTGDPAGSVVWELEGWPLSSFGLVWMRGDLRK